MLSQRSSLQKPNSTTPYQVAHSQPAALTHRALPSPEPEPHLPLLVSIPLNNNPSRRAPSNNANNRPTDTHKPHTHSHTHTHTNLANHTRGQATLMKTLLAASTLSVNQPKTSKPQNFFFFFFFACCLSVLLLGHNNTTNNSKNGHVPQHNTTQCKQFALYCIVYWDFIHPTSLAHSFNN